MARLRSDAMTRGAFPVLTKGLVFLVGDVVDTADQGERAPGTWTPSSAPGPRRARLASPRRRAARGGRAGRITPYRDIAGHSLNSRLCRVLGASTAWLVRRARRPSVFTDETAGKAVPGSFFSCQYSVGMLALTVIT